MPTLQQIQQETIANINTAKAMVDKVLAMLELIKYPPGYGVTLNPIGYLLEILSKIGVTEERLRLWLTNFLVYILPSLEVSVKAILLTNLKEMVSCSIDPRIPDKYRKQHKEIINYTTSQEHGIDISLESIDFYGKLTYNPFIYSGLYFGLDGVDDVYKFARADDFDAFLWFVMHRGTFPNSSRIPSDKTLSEYFQNTFGASGTTGDSLLDTVKVTFSGDSTSSILLGNTFAYSATSHVISMCIDNKYNDENGIVENTMVPTSDDWTSVNWYARRADQLGKNIGFGWGTNQRTGDSKYKGTPRDFSKEHAICNIQFLDQSSSDAPITGLVNNKFRFTILPKPLIDLGKFGPKRMLFNSEGKYDPNGKFTVLTSEEVEGEDGRFSANTKSLIECYKGLTVYEFNYDYVMSMRLFDAKVIVNTLFDSLLNIRLGLGGNVGISAQHIQTIEATKEIIKNIINTDDSEINDCFYTFDNSKYDALLRKTAEAREKKGMSVSAITEILNEYNENAQLHEQIDVLNRAITQATVTVTEGVEGVDSYNIGLNLIFDLIENLTMAVVNSILSPKVLMLLEVNQQMMGGTWEKFTMSDLLKAMQSVIVAVIKEIKDLIIAELLKLTIKELHPIISIFTSALIREQIENYTEAIQDILRGKRYWWFDFSSQQSDTKLDIVDYADIDINTNKEAPKTNNC